MLTCEFARYLEKMRRGRTWGDELTLRGICNSFGCHIHVVTSTEKNWYLEYEPDTVLTDKQVFLCVVESVPLLVCRMCSHTTLCTHRQAGMTHMYPPPHMTHKCSHTTLCTHRPAGMTHTYPPPHMTHMCSHTTLVAPTSRSFFALHLCQSHHHITSSSLTSRYARTSRSFYATSPPHTTTPSASLPLRTGTGARRKGGAGAGGAQ